MPLGKKLYRRSSQGSATPSSEKGSTERKSSLRALRSLSISFPSKERRLSLSSPKKSTSSTPQGVIEQPHSNYSIQQSDDKAVETCAHYTGSRKTKSISDDRTKNGVLQTIPLKEPAEYVDRALSPTESPTFEEDDYSTRNHGAASSSNKSSAPIPMAQSSGSHRAGLVSISELVESPRRYGLRRSKHVVEGDTDGLGPSSYSLNESPQFLGLRNSSDDNLLLNPPSSPLLMAVKKAVDSLNQYEDFDIIEEIGSGFFADVFKVSEPIA